MDKELEIIFHNSQSEMRDKVENALLDLRLIIERYTMNRYSEREVPHYLILFHNCNLIDYRLNDENFKIVKYFLLFLLFNFRDRAMLTAKCIKVLFDKSVRAGICNAIEIYLETDDQVTCELIFAITDVGDFDYFSDDGILRLFKKIAIIGGAISREVVLEHFDYYKENYDPNFSW